MLRSTTFSRSSRWLPPMISRSPGLYTKGPRWLKKLRLFHVSVIVLLNRSGMEKSDP
jgi:hypothetical protein